MKQSELFAKTLKEAPKEAETVSHKLLLRADFISQLASGIYSFLPLGWRVHRKIEQIIREEMDAIGGQEVYLPSLQPKELWKKTGRWGNMDPPLFKLKDRHGSDLALGSTHEEVITRLAQSRTKSYKDLPFALYQIQVKFRNEMRSTGGILRTREFIMKDLYSFHKDQKDLIEYFDKVAKTYIKIFNRCGLKVLVSQASGGTIAGKQAETYEFQVPASAGEDEIVFCSKCHWASNLEMAKVKVGKLCKKCGGKISKTNSIEAAHIFSLGEKYAKDFKVYFADEKGKQKIVTMGCYGIGLGRLMATVVEIHHDDKGIIWPKEIAPFRVHLIQIENNKRVKKISQKLYQDLQKSGVEVLYDDREEKTAGEKFADADLIGIPLRAVVSERTLKSNSLEIKKRSEQKTKLIKISNFKSQITNKFQIPNSKRFR